MAQVAVVTGGSAGIGLATAEALARKGWSVAIVARDPERLKGAATLLQRYGGKVVTISADVADAAAVDAAADQVEQEPSLIEWLTDNGSCFVARQTRRFAAEIGLMPKTTPLESPQSNGMAEAFVRTLKRDYVRVSVLPDAESVMRELPRWLAHYNELHPHRALGYRSPREYIARSTQETLSGL